MLPGDRWDKGNRVAGRSRFICGIEKKEKGKKEEEKEKREEKERKAIPRGTRRERAARQERGGTFKRQCRNSMWSVVMVR